VGLSSFHPREGIASVLGLVIHSEVLLCLFCLRLIVFCRSSSSNEICFDRRHFCCSIIRRSSPPLHSTARPPDSPKYKTMTTPPIPGSGSLDKFSFTAISADETRLSCLLERKPTLTKHSGTCILLVHGLGQDKSSLAIRGLAESLPYNVCTFDARGLGDSSGDAVGAFLLASGQPELTWSRPTVYLRLQGWRGRYKRDCG
jgi:hypothetical protein